MKNMVKLGIILALYATVACVGLAFVYAGTEKIIKERQQADLEEALKELFPEADTFNPVEGIKSPNPQVTVESAYEARRNSELAGVSLRVSKGSYGGDIKVLVGVSAGGTITGVKILEHKDTPGLGANAASPAYYVDKENKITFYGQFANKPVHDPFEVKNDVEAITASTITSRAVTDAVKAAGAGVTAWLAEAAK
ncbi:MAG: RnfABCDGE type electron transport complex subunit G [Treponema sp.]|jgi:electron transport complex protein RnfG|nr:RnfABCDGE type electron transport complex subunit G [Treponema sp.]